MPPPIVPDPLERARVRAVYGTFGLIAVMTAGYATHTTSTIDVGVYATLWGGFLALLGLGAVIRLVGRK